MRRAARGKFLEVRFGRQAADLSGVTSLRHLPRRIPRGVILSGFLRGVCLGNNTYRLRQFMCHFYRISVTFLSH